MQAKKGFTLIELLVVIAIIAILAAILFPVFANARDKARQISDLSNIKEIALSTVMYTSDYDDTYPFGNNFDSGVPWTQLIAPYLGDFGVLVGPNDTKAGKDPSWGYRVSYAGNGYVNNVGGSGAWTRLGVFGTVASTADFTNNQYWCGDYTVVNGQTCKLSSATQPTGTILFADLQSSDVDPLCNYTWTASLATGTWSVNNLIGNDDVQITATNTNSTASYNGAYGAKATDPNAGWDTHNSWEIPNPARPVSASYPGGPNGIVSTPFSSKSLANFAFMDGHAKAQKPVATNPDGAISVLVGTVSSIDQNNEWIVER